MITVYSIVARHHGMIDLQRRAIRRYLDEPHRFVVAINEPNVSLRQAIMSECHLFGVDSLVVPAHGTHNRSESHAAALNYLWRNHASGVVAMIDMDIFPFRDTSLTPLIQDHPVAGVEQVRDVAYPWPGFLVADIARLPDHASADFGVVLGVRDTGGKLADYLARHSLNFARVTEYSDPSPLMTQLGRDYLPEWHCSIVAGDWVHYRNGSDWKGLGETKASPKRQWLASFVERSVASWDVVFFESVVTPELLEGAIYNTHHTGFREDYLVVHCLLRSQRPASVMEVGTNLGVGTKIICNAVPSASVYSLDLPRDDSLKSQQHPSHWGGVVGSQCDLPFTQLFGDSLTFDFSVYPCDAWFIDGEHDERHVVVEASQAIAQNAALIIFHDADMDGVAAGIQKAFAGTKYRVYRVVGTRVAYARLPS